MALVLASPAWGNGCGSVDRDTADAAVELVRRAGSVIAGDWFAPVAVEGVAWRREGFLYRVVVNGELELDLGLTFVPGAAAGVYENLGWKLDCGRDDVPRTIPRSPFAPATEPAEPPPAADEGGYLPQAPLIGILALPELEAAWYDPDRGPSASTIPVHAAPSATAPVKARLSRMKDLPYREYGYERPGAAVLERRPGWYRIVLAEGDGWVAAGRAGDFHGLHELVVENLSFLTPAWDGRLWGKPDRSAAARALSAPWRRKMGGKIAVEVGAARRVEGELWFQVEIVWPPPCGADEPAILTAGWVPAYAASDAPAVWYWSRGC